MTKKKIKDLDGANTLLREELDDLKNKYDDLAEKYGDLAHKFGSMEKKLEELMVKTKSNFECKSYGKIFDSQKDLSKHSISSHSNHSK